MAYVDPVDLTTPPDSEAFSLGASRIRETKRAFKERLMSVLNFEADPVTIKSASIVSGLTDGAVPGTKLGLTEQRKLSNPKTVQVVIPIQVVAATTAVDVVIALSAAIFTESASLNWVAFPQVGFNTADGTDTLCKLVVTAIIGGTLGAPTITIRLWNPSAASVTTIQKTVWVTLIDTLT